MAKDKSEVDTPMWISDRAISKRFEIARSTVWAWARQGRLPKPIKLGNKITRWNSDEVDRFMNQGKPISDDENL